MTGPEHYRQAEKLLGLVEDLEHGNIAGPELIAEAQVRATLALAAATALMPFADPDSGSEDAEITAWRKAAGAGGSS